MIIESWTKAKSDPDKNEDFSAYSDTTIALADGATSKIKAEYGGESGGRVLAKLITEAAIKIPKYGYELASDLTEIVREFYEGHGNHEAISDPLKRSAATLVVARVVDDMLVLTRVGDAGFRLTMKDGSTLVGMGDMLVDVENADTRTKIIMREIDTFKGKHGRNPEGVEFDDILATGREAIDARLKVQYKLQNSETDSTYGYGVVDGGDIPRKFADGTETNYVQTTEAPLSEVATIELVTDGFYGEFPEQATIEAYQSLYSKIHQDDPHKIGKYRSTKPIDDATVIIARLI